MCPIMSAGVRSCPESSGTNVAHSGPEKPAFWTKINGPRIIARGIRHFVTPTSYRQGMGRPRIYDEPRIATAIRLPASLRNELQTVAAARDVSVNYLVTRAVSDYLHQLASVAEGADARAVRGRSMSQAERAAS
jgi:predicted transcriptional regulator